ncbi:MAG: response regulator [gamma proteobacterium symbiont of Taylorina sp.]|nr:response regulator [gamma proteobacterium symbiont of Taylorina sp.]
MLNILVVDDSTMAVRNISMYIKNIGHQVIGEANTAAQAVELCKKLKPDLITMDITMPVLDGITDGIAAVEIIKEFDDSVDIIMVTSHGQENLISKALQAGAKGYILKPLSEEKLAKAIGAINKNYHQEFNESDDEYLL